MITIIFSTVVISVNGLNQLNLNATSTAPPSPTPIATPPTPTTPVANSIPSTVVPWADHSTVLFFPILAVNDAQYALIQIKNTGTNDASDIGVILINRSGESQSYSLSNLKPGEIKRFRLANLINLPVDWSPGLAVVSSNNPLVAVAEIFPANSEEKSPSESLAPLTDLPGDLNFKIYPTADNEPAQNQLAITNPGMKLIEVQIMMTTAEEGTRLLLTKDLPPLATESLELPVPRFQSYDQSATVTVSSTDQIIGAVYYLDKHNGLLSNIRTE